MAKVRKTVLAPGSYQSPQGEVVATPARIKRWVANIKRMKERGINIPSPWGHQANALPEGSDNAAFLASKMNAGYLLDASVGPKGELVFDLEYPALSHDPKSGCLVDPKAGTAIKEVSLGILPKFRDGAGNDYEDVIGHVALTPLPVWAGQEGFQSLALNPSMMTLALPTASGWKNLAMPDEMAPGGTATDDGPPMDDDPLADPGDDDELDISAGSNGGESEWFEKCKPVLTDHGITLPDDTAFENGWEHLFVAMTALQGRLTPKNASGGEGEDNNMAGATPEGPGMVAMSLQLSPLERNLIEAKQKEYYENARKRLERLRKRGCPAEALAKIEQRLGPGPMVTLSLDTKRNIITPELFHEIQILELAFPVKVGTLRTRGATAVPNPLKETATVNFETERKHAADMAAAMGMKLPDSWHPPV